MGFPNRNLQELAAHAADAAAEHQLAVVAARGPASVDIGAGSAQAMHAFGALQAAGSCSAT